MSKRREIEFCGAFTGKAVMRDGETEEEFAARVEQTMNSIFDKHGKRLHVNCGVDYGDLKDSK